MAEKVFLAGDTPWHCPQYTPKMSIHVDNFLIADLSLTHHCPIVEPSLSHRCPIELPSSPARASKPQSLAADSAPRQDCRVVVLCVPHLSISPLSASNWGMPREHPLQPAVAPIKASILVFRPRNNNVSTTNARRFPCESPTLPLREANA